MTRYVFRRLGGAIIILWVIITVTFALMHAIPGGPFTTEKKLPPQVKASIEAKYHLDDPVWKQYGDYLGGVITGDLGPSYKYEGRSVNDIISDAFPISAQLGLLSLMVAVVGGIAAGAISAMRPNGIVDYAVTVLSTIGISVPTFIIGAVLVYVVGFELGWFPVALWRGPSYMVLPVLTLAAQPMAFIARLTRSGLLDVYQQEYIRTARAKGLSSWTILTRHALGNAILPVITYLGPLAASLLTGSFIVETIFAIPGLGQYFVTSIYNRDYTVILGITIFYSALVVFLNILVDMIYPLIDPRVTTEEGTDE
ncbi:MAG: ABC transporter permease [Veillonella dispar]|jgi:oligopeptide transport system permease protein|uniref:ABC transporter permease n=1 Tax=Veillonella TaxID=29465 RepID=UPI000CF50D83|nr:MULTISPECIES: ABC transporter permease [Veillonella]MBS7142278.1 ABC transporter permease [Veillonella sp.]MDU4878009.1 ABC transporter permease [Veillonella dispar]MDU4886265.1 ABC transporter permease [Veillonella dispar]MDU6815969.1 ABC transporter permease [Veillonella sp.]MDU7638709.1 ABC transporter permease [Veillonella dispar]